MKRAILSLLLFLVGLSALAQEAVRWDKTAHEFGDILQGSGPKTCTFTLTNIGASPLAILEVAKSCGCTDISWPRESIAPGAQAAITATYKNEDGPGKFDKTLTVYLSGVKKPVVLHLRGTVQVPQKSLKERYGVQRIGDLGLQERSFQAGTLRQGQCLSKEIQVANLGKKPLRVGFTDLSPELSVSVSPNPIPAQSAASINFTVQSHPTLWGRNSYHATPVLNGRKAEQALEVWALTQEDFTSWTASQREAGPVPTFQGSTFNFGRIKAGKPVTASFHCINKGKSPLLFYKADTDHPALTAAAPLPELAPQRKAVLEFRLDTRDLPKGECVVMVTLTTNSPLRPLVNLFVTGIIE